MVHEEGERYDEVKDNKEEEKAQKSDRLFFNRPTYCGVAMA